MSDAVLRDALELTEQHLFRAMTPEGLIARREAGRELPGDAARARGLAAALVADRQPDGSWRGDMVTTAESLLLLRELRPEGAGDVAVAHALAWLIARQGAPGRFGEQCSPELHALELCAHASPSFFAPAPSSERLGGVQLVSGGRVSGDADARFAASALALRALLVWGGGGEEAGRQLSGLRRSLAAWEEWDDFVISPAARLVAAATVLETEPSPQRAELLGRVVMLIRRSQRGDGSWPGVDAFQVLDVLGTAARRGIDGRVLASASGRCAGMISLWLETVADFTREEVPRRSLIVWRALSFALRSQETVL